MSATIAIEAARDMHVVRALFREYAAWVEVDLCFQGFETEVTTLPGKYAAPDGGLWLARVNRDIAGVVALRPLDARTAELKRLWVRPAHRGHGLGKRLTLHAIEAARHGGYAALRLDTLAKMHEARALYRELGFVPIAPYYENPHPDVAFLELAL